MLSTPPAISSALSSFHTVVDARMRKLLRTASSFWRLDSLLFSEPRRTSFPFVSTDGHKPGPLRVWSRPLLAGSVLLFPLPLAMAQMFTTTNSTMTPVPGAGHDYIHLLSETVNPANGSVSVKLDFPMPKGRGLSIPFSINYTSGQVVFQDTFVSTSNVAYDVGGYTRYTGSMGWLSNVGPLSSGGWSYGVPIANWKSWKTTFGPQLPTGESCPVTSGYTFSDLTGQAHFLGMGEAGYQSGGNQQCQESYPQGGDDFVSSSLAPPPPDYNGGISTPLTVSDNASGTTYLFDGALQSEATKDGQPLRTGLLPYLIEDRNGNEINVTQGFTNSNTGPFAFSFQDTLGRTILSDAAFQANPDTVIAGSQSYTVTWKTTSANYTVNQSQNVSDVGGNCTPVPPVSDSSQTVISSITLPNRQAYHFYYGDDNPNGLSNPYGLLSEIDYPDGGWVRYTWKLSDTYSDLADYPSGINEAYSGNPAYAVLPDGCQFQYTAPVVATRTVGFGGSTAALQQSFTYSTTWDSQFPNRWDSKNTSITTTDDVVGKTSLKTYAYGYTFAGSDAYIYTNSPPQIPMELTVNSYDWGNTSTPIDISNKAWLDQYELACEFHTQNGTSSGHFYQYAPGVQVSDDKEYDFGQIANPGSVCTGVSTGANPINPPSSPTPARETARKFQSFTDLAGMTFTSPQNEILYGNGTKLAETDYGYDSGSVVPVTAISHDETNYGPGSTLARGNATGVKRVNSTGASPATSYTYDETGQILSMQDPNGNTTSYSYTDNYASGTPSGNTNAYLTQITRPAVNVTHIGKFSYRFGDGQLASATDENSQVTGYVYNDPLSRLTETDYADGGKTTLSYNDAAPNPSVTTTQLINSSGTQKTTVAIRDGMSHVVHTRLTSDPSGTDTVDLVYDGQGNTMSATNPYRSTNDPTYGLTMYTHDALGRKIGETESDGSTLSWCYNSIPSTLTGSGTPKQSCSLGNLSSKPGTWVDATNENGTSRQQVSDGLGRLIAVMEPDPVSGTDTLETDYKYDALDNLTQVDQWGGAVNASGDRQRTFVYDSLSQLSSSTNPEAGTIGYTYDNNGNVHTKTDARGVVTTYSYDGLNRLGGKSYTNDPSGTPPAAYAYDTPAQGWNFLDQSSPVWTGVKQTNLVGRLSNEGTGSSATVYGYDALGRTTLKSVCTPTTCGTDHYDLHASYDLVGNTIFADRGLDAARNAASPNAGFYYGGLNMAYSGAGQMTGGTADIVDATHPASIVSGLLYSPLGGMTAAAFGGVYGETDHYTPRGWLYSRVGTINATGYARTGTLMHDPAGNVTSLADTLTNATSTYVPDKLNRLSSYSGPFGAASYGYDAWGNLTSHTNTAGSGYTYSLTMTSQNRVSQTGSTDSAFLYDASGNVLADGLNNYSYDAEDRLAVVNGSTAYVYGPEGERAATLQNGAVNIEYLYSIDGTLTTELAPGGTLVRGLLYGAGMHLADYTQNGKTVFHLADEVGSLVNTIDQTGAATESCAANPFGESLNCSPSVDYTENHFTDKKRDQESNLDYFGARYYGSTFGRFISPDDGSDQDPSDPQSWNLYSYVQNNPLTNTDPDGHDCVTQTRSSSATEDVSVSTGGCTGGAGNGTTQTYVDGTVKLSDVHAGQDGHSIDIGYTDSSGNSGVYNASSAPTPDNPGIALGYQRSGFNTLSGTNRVFNQIGGAIFNAETFFMGGMLGGAEPELGLSGVGKTRVSINFAHDLFGVRSGHLPPPGSPADVQQAVTAALNAGKYSTNGSGVIEGTTTINGVEIGFRGKMVNGTMRIATVFTKR